MDRYFNQNKNYDYYNEWNNPYNNNIRNIQHTSNNDFEKKIETFQKKKY